MGIITRPGFSPEAIVDEASREGVWLDDQNADIKLIDGMVRRGFAVVNFTPDQMELFYRLWIATNAFVEQPVNEEGRLLAAGDFTSGYRPHMWATSDQGVPDLCSSFQWFDDRDIPNGDHPKIAALNRAGIEAFGLGKGAVDLAYNGLKRYFKKENIDTPNYSLGQVNMYAPPTKRELDFYNRRTGSNLTIEEVNSVLELIGPHDDLNVFTLAKGDAPGFEACTEGNENEWTPFKLQPHQGLLFGGEILEYLANIPRFRHRVIRIEGAWDKPDGTYRNNFQLFNTVKGKGPFQRYVETGPHMGVDIGEAANEIETRFNFVSRLALAAQGITL